MPLAGDLDLIAGGDTYIENTGTSTRPEFVQMTGSANPLGGIDIEGYPALGDLDGDGTL